MGTASLKSLLVTSQSLGFQCYIWLTISFKLGWLGKTCVRFQSLIRKNNNNKGALLTVLNEESSVAFITWRSVNAEVRDVQSGLSALSSFWLLHLCFSFLIVTLTLLCYGIFMMHTTCLMDFLLYLQLACINTRLTVFNLKSIKESQA